MPDFFCASSPPIYIVSKRFKDALESLAPSEAEYYPITDHPDNFMLLPKYIIWPPEDVIPFHSDPDRGAIFVAEGKSGIKCNECGQYPQIGIQTYKYVLPEGINFGGIYLGVGFGFVFFASESIASVLKKEKLTGLKLVKNGFAN